MDILLGIFLIVFGLVITFVGLQMFLIMLPLMGFVAGFYLGAEVIAAALGNGFLSTVAGWIVGIVIGVVFAAVAWYWWYAGVLLSAAVVGSVVLSGIVRAFGVSSGAALAIFGIIGAAVAIAVVLALDLPVYMVIWNTALGGGAIAISGIMLLLNQIEREDLYAGAAVAAINKSWFWVLAWVILSAIGVVRQLTLKEHIRLPRDRWAPATQEIAR